MSRPDSKSIIISGGRPVVKRTAQAAPLSHEPRRFVVTRRSARVRHLARLPLVACGGGAKLLVLVVACASWLCGCAAAPHASNLPQPTQRPTEFALPRTVVTARDATSIPDLYDHAGALAREGKHADAAREFERVVRLDPAGELADDALFQAAAEHDEASEFPQAANGYEELARRFPESELRTAALVRASRLRAHLEDWQRAGDIAGRVLASSVDLGPFERVVLYGASALARLEHDDEHAAESFIEKGREVIDANQLDAAGRVSRDLAGLYFALGELRRRRAERIVFNPTPPDFANVLEQRCQLLLDAESAYSDAMRAYDAHWSAMAGFRVAELYEHLHEDLMRVVPPESADTLEKRQLFEGAMRLRYAILLEKALHMVEHTLSMSARTGERSPWVERAELAKANIAAAVKREDAALAALPYSRATIEQALLDLQQKHQADSAGRPRH